MIFAGIIYIEALYKLHNAAHTVTMLSRLARRDMGSSFLIKRKVFIHRIASLFNINAQISNYLGFFLHLLW